jgi:ribosomal protein S27E
MTFVLECPNCDGVDFTYDADTDCFTCTECGETLTTEQAGKLLVTD